MNERIVEVESNWQKGQQPNTPNVQQREMNPCRYANEDDYKEDQDEEYHAPHNNLSRIGEEI